MNISKLEAAAKNYNPRNKPWTARELEILRQFYGKVEVVLLAKELGHSVQAVRCKAQEALSA